MLLRLHRGGPKRMLFYALGLLCVCAVVVRIFVLCFTDVLTSPNSLVVPEGRGGGGAAGGGGEFSRKSFEYNRQMPLIFIGGVPRSGTTLMRAMLDAHPDIRCGQETRVIPRLLQMRFHWLKSEKESLRLEQAGISKSVLDSAIAAFTLEIIANHGDPAPRLCNKDPLTIKMGTYVVELFPNAKFIFMVRDGRATAHSIISRKVTITGFDLTSYRQCLKKWNSAVEAMNKQCTELGSHRCLRVPYEQLVLHPKKWMQNVLDFLDIPWNDSVLHHEDFINNGIILSKVERSSDQVIKPVNLEALTKWVGHIPDDVIRDMAEIAPMLSVLGYDPYENPPSYGHPDAIVASNTKDIEQHKSDWERRAKEMFDVTWGNANTNNNNNNVGDVIENEGGIDKETSDFPNNT